MQENEKDKYFKDINDLYSKFLAESNPSDKRIYEQKIIVKIWEKHKCVEEPAWSENQKSKKKNWGLYADIITETIKNCLSPDSNFDSSKGSFSNYVLGAIKRNIKKEINKKNAHSEKDIQLQQENHNGGLYFLADFIELSPDTKRQLSDTEKINIMNETKDLLRKAENLLSTEKDSDIKAALFTRDILESIYTNNYYPENLVSLSSEFKFLNRIGPKGNSLWEDFFYDHNLYTEEEIANLYSWSKSNARKRMFGCNDNKTGKHIKGFYDKLKQLCER